MENENERDEPTAESGVASSDLLAALDEVEICIGQLKHRLEQAVERECRQWQITHECHLLPDIEITTQPEQVYGGEPTSVVASAKVGLFR